MKKTLLTVAILTSTSVFAADLVEFQSGTPAKASEVNQNFSELENRIENVQLIPGPQGEQGIKGDIGSQGEQGVKGDKGDTGLQGPQGGSGISGPQGEKGDKGDAGVQGIQGEQGLAGDTGLQGDKGDTGNAGIQGEQGIAGVAGPQGDTQWEAYSNHIYYSDGNVGIGTGSADAQLDIKTNLNTDVSLRITNTHSTGGAITQFVNNNNQNWQIGVVGSGDTVGRANDFELYNINAGTPVFSVDASSGNFGIGTNDPQSPLAVSDLPTSPPDSSGNAGVVCSTNDGNFWLDNDGIADCQ